MECGKFWSNIKGKQEEATGNITLVNMYKHCKALYKQPNDGQSLNNSFPPCTPLSPLVSISDVCKGLKKMATRKARDLQGIKAKMLNWTTMEAHTWICNMLNLAIQHGMPNDLNMNWIKPLHKGGDVNNVNNYQTIMVGSLMEKLFGCIMEMKLNTWVKENNKRTLGQADLRKHRSTIDHLVTLQVLMEESRLKGKKLYCCFVDF